MGAGRGCIAATGRGRVQRVGARLREQLVPGIAGVVEDGIVAGLFAYEAGQAAVGDSFAWFVEALTEDPAADPCAPEATGEKVA